MLKIFDASNSNNRPSPRGFGGPVENDIVRYLKKYSSKFNTIFVNDLNNADVIFTNDVFPNIAQESNKPKVKRMDGIYSRLDLIDRNSSLNSSAQIADYVIFISKFSKNSLTNLYPEVMLKKSSVVLNAVDPKEFYPTIQNNNELNIISTATQWERPEKRGDAIVSLAKEFPNIKFNLIGNNHSAKKNIYNLGYIENYQALNKELNNASAFVYLGFNDPAPKTVCQALNCQLPMFLSDSGGNREIGGNIPFYISDPSTNMEFYKYIPRINIEKTITEFSSFIDNIDYYKEQAKTYPSKEHFEKLLIGYFDIFKSVA